MPEVKYLENAGTKVFIGTQAEDHAADTYTQIKRILSIGDFGAEAEVSDDATCLEDTSKEKRKSIVDYGDFTITGNLINGDPGQANLDAAAKMHTNVPHNIKIVFPDEGPNGNGSTYYLKCFVSSFKRSPGQVNGHLQFSSQLAITGAPVEVPAS